MQVVAFLRKCFLKLLEWQPACLLDISVLQLLQIVHLVFVVQFVYKSPFHFIPYWPDCQSLQLFSEHIQRHHLFVEVHDLSKYGCLIGRTDEFES